VGRPRDGGRALTSRAGTLAAAALCGLAAGAASAFLLGRDAGRGRGADGTLRGDLDRLEARVLECEAASAERLAKLVARLEAAEGAGAAGAPGDPVAESLAALAEDLRALRDALRRDLGSVESRLIELERRVADAEALLPVRRADERAPPTEEEEAVWVNLAQDPDPLRRFSALARLGRTRTDRSVRASVEALADGDERVLWQALRNLGGFSERAAARDAAALLDHPLTVVRAASSDALRRMGAPDSGFDATASPEKRRAPSQALRSWAAEQ
jgi:hypothetical protein